MSAPDDNENDAWVRELLEMVASAKARLDAMPQEERDQHWARMSAMQEQERRRALGLDEPPHPFTPRRSRRRRIGR